jgi:GAF domain-containing protein
MKKLIITPNEIQKIDLTADEIAQAETNNINYAIILEQEEIKKAQELANKQSALNKLKALGLNDAEIKSIIG